MPIKPFEPQTGQRADLPNQRGTTGWTGLPLRSPRRLAGTPRQDDLAGVTAITTARTDSRNQNDSGVAG
jgi:hypothetical protein